MCHLYPYNNAKLLRKFFYITYSIGNCKYKRKKVYTTYIKLQKSEKLITQQHIYI